MVQNLSVGSQDEKDMTTSVDLVLADELLKYPMNNRELKKMVMEAYEGSSTNYFNHSRGVHGLATKESMLSKQVLKKEKMGIKFRLPSCEPHSPSPPHLPCQQKPVCL